jgi:hypothetical protein
MRIRTLAFLAAAGAAAAVQAEPLVTLMWHWKNMATGDQSPLEPGQPAMAWLNVSMSIAPGSLLPSGQTSAGLAAMFLDLNAMSNVFGTWVVTGTGPVAFPGTPEIDGPGNNVPQGWQSGGPVLPLHWGRRNDPGLPGSGWAFGQGGDGTYDPIGTHGRNPGSLATIQLGQFPTTTATNMVNPVNEIWRGMFTPDSYAPRDMVWAAQKSPAASTPSGISLYQIAGGPVTLYSVPLADVSYGALVIPLVPSPSAMAVLGFGGLVALRRRRVWSGRRAT